MHFFRPSLDTVYLLGCSTIEERGFFLGEGGWYCFFIIFVIFCVCACFNNDNRSN